MPTEDSTSESDENGEQHENRAVQSDETRSISASRRQVLATVGALSLGTAFGLGTAAGQSDTVGPDTFEEFEAAVDENLETAQEVIDQGPYEPTWDSLEDVQQVPEWFRDGKFGIYFHWGLYSVPAFSTEWYPKWMYIPDRDGWGDEVHDYHVENYGEPDEYPYQDFAAEFTAEEFDPEEWADLFDKAGAQFAGPVAEHHDGWANWASGINPFNAADMGPGRDIVGELESSIRDRGMEFVATFHHGRPAKERDGLEDKYYEGAYDNYPSVTEEFPNRIMYRNVETDLRWGMWFGKLVEAIERYEPDLVWHDSIHNPPEHVKRRYLAYNYNRAVEEDRDIAITQKEDALPLNVSIEDFENERPVQMLDQAWLTDTTLSTGAWCYTEDQEYKPTDQVLHTLIDIVSKNGQMLLNLSPRADGTIPKAQRDRLQAVGDWLDVNGEAIYETRPWDLYGTGPNWLGDYSAEDVRYTQSKDGETLYAIVLGWPDQDTLTLNGTYVEDPSNAPGTPPGHGGSPPGEGNPPVQTGPTDVTLLGHGSVDHSVDEHGHVVVDVPDLDESGRPSDTAVAFKLEGFDLSAVTADYATSSEDIFVGRTAANRHQVAVTVHNRARGEAPPTMVQIENAETGAIIGEEEIGSLPLDGSTTVTVEWDTSDLEDGTEQDLRVVVDPDDEVTEQHESNNVATTTVRLLDSLPERFESYASTEAFFGTWDDTYVINANGVDTWDPHDEYGTIYESDSVDQTTTVTTKVSSVEDTGPLAKAGIMVRNDITAAGESTGYVTILVTPDRFQMLGDSDGDGYLEAWAGDQEAIEFPVWLKLERDGSVFTGYTSTDGSNWTELDTMTIEAVDDVQDAGMYVCAAADELHAAEFAEFDTE